MNKVRNATAYLLAGYILAWSAHAAEPTVEGEAEASPELSKKERRAARREELKAQVDALLARDPEREDYVDDERCISTGNIRDVEVLDDRHVTFRVRRNEYYLVQFEHRCPGLRRNRPVMYESNSSRLCVHDGIRALYERGFGGYDPGMRCSIPGFQSVTREQVDGLKAVLRKKPKTS